MVHTELFEGWDEILEEASNLAMSNTATVRDETVTVSTLACLQQSNSALLLRWNLTEALLRSCAIIASWIEKHFIGLGSFWKMGKKTQYLFSKYEMKNQSVSIKILTGHFYS